MTQVLDCVEIEPTQAARSAIVWLHGLGANGHDFEPIVPELNLPADSAVRFVFPHAPMRAVTINNGYVMPAWFDITALDRLEGASKSDIETSVQQINALIEKEHQRGIEYKNIVVAGFSQGGVIALHVAIRFPQTLAGVLALSTYLPCHEELKSLASGKNRDIPVFAAHGTYDPMIPIKLGRLSNQIAKEFFTGIAWQEYPMEHSVCFEEIQAIADWIKTRIFRKTPN
ncbi:MAG: dienelactone hydrolase family protein [Gammaproteobacteria bacterium]|nr:dienelactone hydrolase family protein [Gammaproteobacteria bacterium]